MRSGLIITILLLVALAYFNPGMEDFRLFVGSQSEILIRQEAGDGAIADLLATIGGRFASDHIDRITERRNYVIFSTYTINVDVVGTDDDDWKFLGIPGRFVETQRPRSLE